MGRECRHPGILNRYDGNATGKLDWLLMETALWAEEDQDFTAWSTLLVSCAQAPNICGSLAVPADNGEQTCCKHGRNGFAPGMAWRAVCGTDGVIDSAVVYVDESATLPPNQIGPLIHSLKAAGVDFVVVVCAALATRQAISGADAFVVGSTETTIRTAGMLAQLFSHVIHAPAMASCTDVYDLYEMLRGKAETPCVLAEALWRWSPTRLDGLDPVDTEVIMSAQSIVLDPGPLHGRLAAAFDLRRHIRALHQNPDLSLEGAAAYGPFRTECDSPRAALVRLLCVPHAAA